MYLLEGFWTFTMAKKEKKTILYDKHYKDYSALQCLKALPAFKYIKFDQNLTFCFIIQKYHTIEMQNFHEIQHVKFAV